MSQSIAEVLANRKSTHGAYKDHAACTQAIMQVCMSQPNWRILCPEYKEGIHMIAHKLGRILTGTPYHEDHVVDIIGYTTLMQNYAKDRNEAENHMHTQTMEVNTQKTWSEGVSMVSYSDPLDESE